MIPQAGDLFTSNTPACGNSGAASYAVALAGQQPLAEKQSSHLRNIKSLLLSYLNNK